MSQKVGKTLSLYSLYIFYSLFLLLFSFRFGFLFRFLVSSAFFQELQPVPASPPLVEDYEHSTYGEYHFIQSQVAESRSFTPISSLVPSLAGQDVWIRGRVHTIRAKGDALLLFSLSDKSWFLSICPQERARLLFCVLVLPQFKLWFGRTKIQLLQSRRIWSNSLGSKLSIPLSSLLASSLSFHPCRVACESIVDVFASIKALASDKLITSTTQKDVELGVKRFFIISHSLSQLPFQIPDAMRKESEIQAAEAKGEQLVRVLPDTRLDARWIDLRVGSALCEAALFLPSLFSAFHPDSRQQCHLQDPVPCWWCLS